MDAIQLFQDFGVDHYTTGYKYCRPGWVNVECPFCTGNPGPHLGYNLGGNYFHCWRCGGHELNFTLSKLLNISTEEVKKIVKEYGHRSTNKNTNHLIKFGQKSFKLPSGSGELMKAHKRYLEDRGFDPDYLEKEWGLLGTGPISKIDDISYKNRIIIPFYWNGKLVSFDSRDITSKHVAKYMACPLEREIIPHKHILFGKQSKWKETGIGVEGPFDVFRLGPYSCATSGINYKPEQIRTIAKHFKRFAVIFDVSELEEDVKKESQFSKKAFDSWRKASKETQAAIQANKLVSDLKFRGVDAFRVDIKGDPGGMDQKEADYLVKQIIK